MGVKSYIFGRTKFKPVVNTFIGGVASTLGTASLLAAKLGIAVSRISLFSVVGSNIECSISGTYAMPSVIFQGVVSTNNNPGITFYKDIEKLCISLGLGSFYSNQQQMLITEINFGGVISVGDYCFLGGGARSFIKKIVLPQATTLNGGSVMSSLPDLELVYIPRCTILGVSVGNNNIFTSSKLSGTIIYANPFLQTNNAGSVDGDLAFAISIGAIVRYVTNFTAPNPILILSAGTIYNTVIQINFTAPSITNAIDFYEVYVNGVFNRNVTASGQYITGLTANTTYNITIVAVDVFYNKSVVSNVLIVSTTNVTYSDADATAYINASALTNSSDVESTHFLFTALKDNLLYTKIQAGYLFKGNTAANQMYNIKNPLNTNAAFRLTFAGTGTHSSLGYTGNGTTGYANTNFIPSANQNVNSNGLTIVVGTNNATVTSDTVEIGSFNGVTQCSILVTKNNNTTFRKVSRLNGDALFQDNVNEARGIFTAVRQSVSVAKLIRNTVTIASTTANNGTLPTLPLWIGALNLSNLFYGGSNQRIQIALIHEGLTDAEVATLHSIIDISETIAGRKTW
jgi:hypothetical protein